jgi:CHAT domain
VEYEDLIVEIKSDLTVIGTFRENPESSKLLLSNEIRDFVNEMAIPGRNFDTPAVLDFGNELRKALFSGDLEKQFLDVMKLTEESGLGVRLLLKVDPEFVNYPWEAMSYNYIPLGTDIRIPIIRILPGNNSQINLKEGLPKPLVILSNVQEQYYVDTAREWEIIRDALSNNLYVDKPVPVDVATRQRIESQMSKASFNIIHFVGHADVKDKKNFLALRDEDGALDKADEDLIRALFLNEESLGLIILNACSTAKFSSEFTGLVPKLLMRVPAIVAMRQPISNPAAKAFTAGFYTNLLDSIEVAVQKARNSMFISKGCNGNDFTIPVIYLGWRNGRTAKKIFVKSYTGDGTPFTLEYPSRLKAEDILRKDFRELDRNYDILKKTVTTIHQSGENMYLFSTNGFLWEKSFTEFRTSCSGLHTKVRSFNQNAAEVLEKKYLSLFLSVDHIFDLIKKGKGAEINPSLEVIDKDYEALTVLYAKVLAGKWEES